MGESPPVLVGTAPVDDWGNWSLWDGEVDIQAGDLITVSNGTLAVSHTVTPLTITEVNPETDVIRGTAEPLSSVNVAVYDYQEVYRTVQADESGNWDADFSVAAGGEYWEAAFDIVTGTEGSATQEGDTSVPYGSTQIHWRVVNPFFHMNPRSHAIWGRDWPSGETVTILVGDPENPDYEAVVNSDGDGAWWIEDDKDPVVLALGARVQATCGAYVKTGIVEFVQILEVDGAADVVRGKAAPGRLVLVGIDNADAGREVQADAQGQWLADFSTAAGGDNGDRAFDIGEGTQGVALIQDEDGDGSLAPWRFSSDPPEVFVAWFEGVGDGPSPYSEFVVEFRGGGIVSARIRTPLGAWHDLALDDWWGENWFFQGVEQTFDALDAVFPAGEYRLAVVGADGVSTSVVTVAQSLERPNQMPVIVSPQTGVAWPQAYLQWNAPTNANFGATIVQVRDDNEDFDFETHFADVSVSEALVSGLNPSTEYESNVIFANMEQIETNGIPFEFARATFAVMPFTTALDSDPTLTNRVSWYTAKGVGRGLGESWEFLEGRDRFGKGMTLQQEYVADTDPMDPASVFRIEAVDLGPPIAVQVIPSSSARVYTLLRRANLHEGQWGAVPGQVDVPGGDGELCDNADPGDGFFYRVQVEVP